MANYMSFDNLMVRTQAFLGVIGSAKVQYLNFIQC
jgi:hypothetical protein